MGTCAGVAGEPSAHLRAALQQLHTLQGQATQELADALGTLKQDQSGLVREGSRLVQDIQAAVAEVRASSPTHGGLVDMG